MKLTTNEKLAELVAAYAADRTIANRNRLVEACLFVVFSIARKIKRAMPRADFDDITSAGSIGLIEATERFDGFRGVPFLAYVKLRIRGAMLDQIRNVDVIPRDVRRRHSRWLDAADVLRSTLGREPTRPEIERTLKLRPGQWARDVGIGDKRRYSLDAARTIRADEACGESFDVPDNQPPIGSDFDSADSFAAMLATPGLGPHERVAIQMHYGEGELQRTVAERLGRKEGSTSQLMRQARETIAGHLVAA